MAALSKFFRMQIRTLDHTRLSDASAELFSIVCHDFQPTLLLGIRRGGYIVAERMLAGAAHERCSLLALSRCRPSTRKKNQSATVKRLLRALPRFAADRLRVIEHVLLTGIGRPRATPFTPDASEFAAVGAHLQAHGDARILIVDDAVDSGATLAAVRDVVKGAAPCAIIKTAAIVVTTENPIIEPDYFLYRHELCRFPWSLDFED